MARRNKSDEAISATMVTLSRFSRPQTICHGRATLDGDGPVDGGGLRRFQDRAGVFLTRTRGNRHPSSSLVGAWGGSLGSPAAAW